MIQIHSECGGGVAGWLGDVIWTSIFGPKESLRYTWPPQPNRNSSYSKVNPLPNNKMTVKLGLDKEYYIFYTIIIEILSNNSPWFTSPLLTKFMFTRFELVFRIFGILPLPHMRPFWCSPCAGFISINGDVGVPPFRS